MVSGPGENTSGDSGDLEVQRSSGVPPEANLSFPQVLAFTYLLHMVSICLYSILL